MVKKIQSAVVTTAVAALLLAACSSGDDSNGSTNGGEVTADPNETVELEFWAWGSNIDKRVEVWNEANSHIKVNISAPAGGADMPVQVLNAARAGNGPDMAQAEFTQLPTYVSAGVLADVEPNRAMFEEAYSEATIETVTFDGTIYGIPQDLGPALFVYRSDIMDELGLETAETWDEFKELAREVREVDPNRYLMNFSAIEADQFMGLALQNGAQWWSFDGDSWEVKIDDAATQEVLDFWQELIEEDLVSTYQVNSPEEIEATANGRIIGRIAGAWAPGPLMNQHPDTAGLWDASQIPQWDLSDKRVYARGGSSNVILKDTEHYDAALEFLTWLNASEEGVEGLVEVNKFTAALYGQELDRPAPDLMPDNDGYWPAANEAASNLVNVQWGPNTQVAFTAVSDALSQAIEGNSGWDSVLATVQTTVANDLAG